MGGFRGAGHAQELAQNSFEGFRGARAPSTHTHQPGLCCLLGISDRLTTLDASEAQTGHKQGHIWACWPLCLWFALVNPEHKESVQSAFYTPSQSFSFLFESQQNKDLLHRLIHHPKVSYLLI